MPYIDDEGNEIDPANVPLPKMCRMCEKLNDPHEEIVCDLIRLNQRNESHFRCEAFVGLYGALIDGIIE